MSRFLRVRPSQSECIARMPFTGAAMSTESDSGYACALRLLNMCAHRDMKKL